MEWQPFPTTSYSQHMLQAAAAWPSCVLTQHASSLNTRAWSCGARHAGLVRTGITSTPDRLTYEAHTSQQKAYGFEPRRLQTRPVCKVQTQHRSERMCPQAPSGSFGPNSSASWSIRASRTRPVMRHSSKLLICVAASCSSSPMRQRTSRYTDLSSPCP